MSRRTPKQRTRDAEREAFRRLLWLRHLSERTDPLSTLVLLEGFALFFGDDHVNRERPPIDAGHSPRADVRRASRKYVAAVEFYREGRSAYRKLAGTGKRVRGRGRGRRRACDWLIVSVIHMLESAGGLAVPSLCQALAEAWDINLATVTRAWKRRAYGRATRQKSPITH